MPSGIQAQEGERTQLLSFVDDSPFAIDYADLIEQNGRIDVQIRNNDPVRSQQVKLALTALVSSTGIETPLSDQASTSDAIEQTLGPMTNTSGMPAMRTFTLTLPIDRVKQLQAGVYKGTLEAVGSLGETIRRSFTLRVPLAVISGNLTELTLAGINCWPSLLNPINPELFWPSSLFVLYVLALFGILGWPLKLAARPINWVKLAAGLIVPTALFVILIATLREQPPQLHNIKVQPLHVSYQAASRNGPVIGEVIDGNGGLGNLVIEDNKLKVFDIPRAGKYSGQFARIPTDQGSAIKLTVNARDAAPYALLTVAIGVALGYLLTWYYKKGRTELEQWVRSSRLKAAVTTMASATDRNFRGYSIMPVVEKWLALAEQDLRNDQIDKAKVRLDKLEAYIELFRGFPDWLAYLSESEQQVRASLAAERFGLEMDVIPVLSIANGLLVGKEVKFPHENEEGTYLAALDKSVKETITWLRTLQDVHALIVNYYKKAQAIANESGSWADQTCKPKIQDEVNKIKAAGRKALMADKKEIVEQQLPVTMAAWVAILDYAEQGRPKREGADMAAPIVDAVDNGATYRRYALPMPGTSADISEQAVKTYQRLLAAFKITDWQVTIITGILAISSGFATLYFANPTWGAPVDYLNALLWGSVVSEGLKVVGSIVSRTWQPG